MCGLAGFMGRPGEAVALRASVRRMASRLSHRGPDDHGEWVDASLGVALGHRRLAIIDLTPHGHQPMLSHSGRYVIAYNGEIYNYASLRAELDTATPGIAWRGHSDTEVALAAIDRWGLVDALARFDGMFAMAVWDRQTHQMHFARDQIGRAHV